MSDTRVRQDANHMWIDSGSAVICYVEAEGTFWRTVNGAEMVPAKQVSSLAWVTAGGESCGFEFGGYGGCIAPKGHTEAHCDANCHRFNPETPTPPAEPVKIQMVEATVNEARYGIAFRSASDRKIKGAKYNRHASFTITIWLNVFRPNPHPVAVWKGVGMIGGPGKYLGADNKGTDEPYSVTASAQAAVISNRPGLGGQLGEEISIGQAVVLVLPDGTELGPFIVTDRRMADPYLVPSNG